jgi:Ca2+/H+ antiporter
MDLNFEIFMVALLLITIIVVGNFLRDGESNYLEGALLVVSEVIRIVGCHSLTSNLDCLSNHGDGHMVLS